MAVAFYVMVIGAVSWLIFVLLIIGIVAYMSTSNEEENDKENGWIFPANHRHSTYEPVILTSICICHV